MKQFIAEVDLNNGYIRSIRPVEIVRPCKHRNPSNRTTITDTIKVDESGEVRINGICANVVCYKIIVPDKVMIVEFVDGSREKMVCNKEDTFSIEDGIRIAIAKHVGRKYYNVKGIENLATRLSYLTCIDKMIHKAQVEYRRREREAEKKDKNQKSIKKEKTTTRRAGNIKITQHHREEQK